MAFGGAGPLHAGDLMREAGIRRAIVPLYPGQFSAFGFIVADAKVDLERTVDMTSARFDSGRAEAVLEGLRDDALKNLHAQGYRSDITLRRTLEMRYLGQNYELEIAIDFDEFNAENLEQLWQQFHQAHEQRFGFDMPGEVIELTTIKCSASAASDKPDYQQQFETHETTTTVTADKQRTVHYIGGERMAELFRREDLQPSNQVIGPGLIEEAASVTVINPGQQALVSAHGHIIISENTETKEQ